MFTEPGEEVMPVSVLFFPLLSGCEKEGPAQLPTSHDPGENNLNFLRPHVSTKMEDLPFFT